jgi:D-alanyl-D-alanine carboxypeptidase
MRHQALLLIAVILVSVTTVKGFAFFDERAQVETITPDMQASIAETLPRESESPSEPPRAVELKGPAVYPEYAGERTRVSVATGGQSGDVCAAVGSKIAYAREVQGDILYTRNISQRWPIASITKLMTAVIAMERYDPSVTVMIDAEDIEKSEGFPTFSAGTALSVNDMVRSLLVGSSNDAAFALADLMGQTEFVGRMQAKAQELGMSQTTFFEPSGLSYLNQSTASDLYLLVRYIQQYHPYLFESTKLKTITVRDTGQQKNKTVANVDIFAGRKDFLGGKTGFIDQSGGNLVTLFRSNNATVFLVVLGSADRFGETEKLLACSANAKDVVAQGR